jgi:hypothetical protein
MLCQVLRQLRYSLDGVIECEAAEGDLIELPPPLHHSHFRRGDVAESIPLWLRPDKGALPEHLRRLLSGAFRKK